MNQSGTEPLRPADPSHIGPYQLIGRLGEGGMGTVYLALAPSERAVAVKVVKPEFTVDENFAVRFHAEVENARRVASFCTAQVLDNGNTEDGRPYMVTEYIPGTPLSRQIAMFGALDPGPLHGVALGVAAALAAIHVAGLVHRDLKPSNVILSMSGPRVIDFGISRALDASTSFTQSGELVGSPGWWAPEQVRGDAITPAADIFAWGCLVAYSGNGRHPYGRGDALTLAARVLNSSPDLGALPAPLNNLVRLATDPDPARRPTAQELLIALVSGGVPAPMPTPDDTATVVATEILTESWQPPANVRAGSGTAAPAPAERAQDIAEDMAQDSAQPWPDRAADLARPGSAAPYPGSPHAAPGAAPASADAPAAASQGASDAISGAASQAASGSVSDPGSDPGSGAASDDASAITAPHALPRSAPSETPSEVPSEVPQHADEPARPAAWPRATGPEGVPGGASGRVPPGGPGVATGPHAGPGGLPALGRDPHVPETMPGVPTAPGGPTMPGHAGPAVPHGPRPAAPPSFGHRPIEDMPTSAGALDGSRRRRPVTRWLVPAMAIVAALAVTTAVLVLVRTGTPDRQVGPGDTFVRPVVDGPDTDIGRRVTLPGSDVQVLIPQPPKCEGGRCTVRLSLVNTGGTAVPIAQSPRLVDDQGGGHDLRGESTALPESIAPGEKIDGMLVFDVPPERRPAKLLIAEGIEVRL